MALYLSYDGEAQQDGVGAQIIRILGVYSISKAFRIGYIHTPIKNIIEEVSHNFSSNTSSTNFKNMVNEFFQISHFSPSRIDSYKIYKELTLWQLLKLVIVYKYSKSSVVVKIAFPFKITDRMPGIYKHAKNYFWAKHQDLLKVKPGVVVHIRFGYGFLYTEKIYMRNRHLPLSYFRDIIISLQDESLNANRSNVTIHTDLKHKNEIWKPSQPEVARALKKLNGGKEAVLITGVDIQKKLNLPKGINVEVKYSQDFFDCFLDMCTAEIFVMGRSALSYLAGILNPNMVIYPESHGHRRLKNWVSSNKHTKSRYSLIHETDLSTFLAS